DFNGDGKADLVVSPDQGGGPRVSIYDGAAAGGGLVSLIADFFGIGDANFRGGDWTATGGINGDGVPDLVVAAGFLGGPRGAAGGGVRRQTSTQPAPGRRGRATAETVQRLLRLRADAPERRLRRRRRPGRGRPGRDHRRRRSRRRAAGHSVFGERPHQFGRRN